MKYKEIKRLTKLVSEYHWYDDCGLMVFIDYDNCKEVFTDIFNIDLENCPHCYACPDYICIPHFDDFLADYTNEDIRDIFPNEED